MKKIIYTLMIVWMGMTACTPSVENPTMVNRKPSIYPDYIGVTIPADIAPMNFNIKGDTVDVVDVVAKGSKGGELHVSGEWAKKDVFDNVDDLMADLMKD